VKVPDDCECGQALYRRRNATCPACMKRAFEAIDALHQATEPILDAYTGLGDSWCEECGPDQPWPCTTARLIDKWMDPHEPH
jgi:hypothetical protein